MKIYFAGSIRGGRKDAAIYYEIISHLKQYGEVLTEHIGDNNLNLKGEENVTDQYIHDRDMKWIMLSNVLIAEVTNLSLGVGYEIGRAIENKKKVLCLYRPTSEKRLSAMIAGCPEVINKEYTNLEEAKKSIDEFFKEIHETKEQNKSIAKYDKLVRDKIPEIISKKGIVPIVHVASNKEYEERLLKKLQEEVSEFLDNSNEEELADIQEVIYAICDFYHIDKNKLEKTRKDKAKLNGEFKNRIVLEETKKFKLPK